MSQGSQAGTSSRTCSSSCPEPPRALRCGAPGEPQGTQMGWGTPGTPGTDTAVPPAARMESVPLVAGVLALGTTSHTFPKKQN